MIRSALASRPKVKARIGGNGSGLKVSDDVGSNFGPSRQKFVAFLFDLVADSVKEKRSLPNSEAELLARVEKEVLVAFNYEKKARKENLVVR